MAQLNTFCCLINMHGSSIMTGPYRLERNSFHDTAYLIGWAEMLLGERALNYTCVKKLKHTLYMHTQGRKEGEETYIERAVGL